MHIRTDLTCTNADFADRLALVRRARGMNQTTLGIACGSTQSLITHYENRRAYPNVVMLARICTALSVSADFLIGLKDTESLFVLKSNRIATE